LPDARYPVVNSVAKVRSATLLRTFQDFGMPVYAFTPANPRRLVERNFCLAIGLNELSK
jgi:hypothetical protein